MEVALAFDVSLPKFGEFMLFFPQCDRPILSQSLRVLRIHLTSCTYIYIYTYFSGSVESPFRWLTGSLSGVVWIVDGIMLKKAESSPSNPRSFQGIVFWCSIGSFLLCPRGSFLLNQAFCQQSPSWIPPHLVKIGCQNVPHPQKTTTTTLGS